MSVVADIVKGIAKKDFSIDLMSSRNSAGALDFRSKIDGTDIGPHATSLIIDTTDRYLRNKYDYNKLPSDKKIVSSGMYKKGGYIRGEFITTKNGGYATVTDTSTSTS